MRGIEFVAEDIGRDLAMQSQAIKPGDEGQRDSLVRWSPGKLCRG